MHVAQIVGGHLLNDPDGSALVLQTAASHD